MQSHFAIHQLIKPIYYNRLVVTVDAHLHHTLWHLTTVLNSLMEYIMK